MSNYDETEAEGIIQYIVHVHKDDMGKVIGKEQSYPQYPKRYKIAAMKNEAESTLP